jgi:hypothetical protein
VITVPFRPIAPPDLANGKVSPWSQINLSFGTEFVYVRKSILAPEGECHTRGLTSGAFTFRAERTPWWDDIVHCEVLEVKENERLVYTWLGLAWLQGQGANAHGTEVRWTLRPTEARLSFGKHSLFWGSLKRIGKDRPGYPSTSSTICWHYVIPQNGTSIAYFLREVISFSFFGRPCGTWHRNITDALEELVQHNNTSPRSLI